MDRRTFLALTGTTGVLSSISSVTGLAAGGKTAVGKSVGLTLSPLPYAEDALVPHISAQTMRIHYGKHHQAYVDKYNELIKGTPMASQTLEEVIQEAAKGPEPTPLFNAGAQAWNHTFFWQSMRAGGGGEPKGKLKEMIDGSFGSFKKFRDEFAAKSMGLFGSGWAWLASEGDRLKVIQTKDADTPIVRGLNPLLTIDVWEHAYYLDYQNRRKDFVEAFLSHLVNWEFASSRLK